MRVERLVHLTNYWGDYVEAQCRDDETDGLPLIWAQALFEGEGCCCPNFGTREIELSTDHLWAHHEGKWSLWEVSRQWGHTEGHRFCKFVLAPDEDDDNLTYHGWQHLGSAHFQNGLGILGAELPRVLAQERADGWCTKVHMHVGIYMEGFYSKSGPHHEDYDMDEDYADQMEYYY
eukprot:TRINITY_DN41820_c0_g1_i1.p1 TRINITY_DN41820_c0_g1~~TRINITY_DN41820_c0_g1_i1.p1  ORF type:complete len:194 (-),score=33.74 TRINITY_DN41820_c0_g1_i1:151-678(-)